MRKVHAVINHLGWRSSWSISTGRTETPALTARRRPLAAVSVRATRRNPAPQF